MNNGILTLGSLFDGIGGFPFAASIVGIKPVWAAEIDHSCAAVTKKRFPDMEHLGSVTEINGADIPPVDIITFGSPCQDLSVAGNQAGLDGEHSGLFKEAVRIIYEMRKATNGKYPTFIIWENVPGAFSSNKGRDFRTVLEEIAKTDIPMPASGKWATAGVVRSAEINVAWRQLDAQYWGVPQRRKRIYLVGSFGNNSAEEILFEHDSVRRYLAPRGTQGERTVADTERSVAVGSECFDARGNGGDGTVPTMTGDHNGRVNDYCAVAVQAKGFPLGFRPENTRLYDEKATTLCNGTRPGFCNGVLQGIFFFEAYQHHGYRETDISGTITAGRNGTVRGDMPVIAEKITVCFDDVTADEDGHKWTQVCRYCKNKYSIPDNLLDECGSGICGIKGCNREADYYLDFPQDRTPVFCIQGKSIGRADKNAPNGSGINEDVSFTLNTVDNHAVCYGLPLTLNNVSSTLRANAGMPKHEQDFVGRLICQPIYALDRASFNQGANALYDFEISDAGINSTLVAKGPSAVAYEFIEWIVRRLTPLECERLQGYPDGWTELPRIKDMSDEDYSFFLKAFLLDKEIRGKPVNKPPTKASLVKWYNKLDCDGNRYRQLGNSLAIPCALRVVGGIADYIAKEQKK